MVDEWKWRRPLLALWLCHRLLCLASWLCRWRVHTVELGWPRRGERWRALWILRPRALHASKGLLLLGIWGPRHGLLRMLWARHRRLMMLWSRHGRLRNLRTLRSRRTGLHILLLPWSLLVIWLPLRIKLRKLSRVHVGLVLVGAED